MNRPGHPHGAACFVLLVLAGCSVNRDLQRYYFPAGREPQESNTDAPELPSHAVRRVSFEQPPQPLPTAPLPAAPQPAAPRLPLTSPEVLPAPTLALRDVTESVYYSFPAIDAAIRNIEIADGKLLAAEGEFDLKMKAESLSAPQGFYKTYRNLAKLEQALYPGGNVFGQYRIGDGNFQPWYGERETNEGGEFKVGFITPLLRDRAIDHRRWEILQATLHRQQADPEVQARILEFTYFASDAYWSWVAAGQSFAVQRDLLRVTTERNRGLEERVKRQDLAAVELLQNQRLIASRETKLIEADRKLQQAAIKLSLFLRDDQGQPVLPARSQLPPEFPASAPPDPHSLDASIAAALDARPELRDLDLQRERAEVDLAYGQNQLLPALNATLEASKDVGYPASKKGDKTPFELEAGLLFEMPLQRRKAFGKVQEAQGKLAQIAAKRRYAADKIAVEVRDALSALTTAYARIQKAHENTVLAIKLEQAERARFAAGDSDMLRVTQQETAAIEAELLEIEARQDYYRAAAALRAATAAPPLQGQF